MTKKSTYETTDVQGISIGDLLRRNENLEWKPLNGCLANSADSDQTPQIADQGLHCLQIVKPFFFKDIQIIQPDIPKIENGLFQYIVWRRLYQSLTV